MVNISTNINNTNNNLSSKIIKNKKPTTFEVGNPFPGLGQVQN
jgi:hypothetical protein